MSTVPVICTDDTVITNLKVIFTGQFPGEEPVFLSNPDEVLEYLKYELPELVVYYLADEIIDIRTILDEVLQDSWILYGGIIAIESEDGPQLPEEYLKQFNLLARIPVNTLDFSFPRAFRIIHQNRNILFHRDFYNKLLETVTGTFTIDNDPFDIKTYANLVTNYLYNSDFLNMEMRDRLQVSLMELLMNAIEHGNCSISYTEKNNWLQTHGDIFDLIREKNGNSEISSRKVRFSYQISTDSSAFSICDDGAGFDWRSALSSTAAQETMEKHGHGIKMSDYYLQGIQYNDAGNCVSFTVEHRTSGVNAVPAIFKDQRERFFSDGEIVFAENEESNFLYYIVNGRFTVSSRGKHLSTLTPADMFLGEMSFLVNNRRSATVTSLGKSSLIKISKVDFVNLIRKNPHYGMFLARLLAQRLQKLNDYTAQLQT